MCDDEKNEVSATTRNDQVASAEVPALQGPNSEARGDRPDDQARGGCPGLGMEQELKGCGNCDDCHQTDHKGRGPASPTVIQELLYLRDERVGSGS